MVKAEEKGDVGEEKNGEVSKENQETWFLGTQPFVTTKGEPMGPKIIQPPEGKKPQIKPIDAGGRVEPNGQLNQQPVPHLKAQVVQGDNLQENPHKGHQILEGEKVEMNRGRNNHHQDLLLGKMAEVEEMVMIIVVMMEMTMKMMMQMMMRRRMRMMETQKQSLRVKVAKIQMHLVVRVYQENQEEEMEVMDHHLIWGLEMWNLEVEGDIKVREDKEHAQVHRVCQVYRDHKDLKALRV